MELKVSVSEVLALIKEVENVPAKIFEYIGVNIQEAVGKFLTNLMDNELTHHMNVKKVRLITVMVAIAEDSV